MLLPADNSYVRVSETMLSDEKIKYTFCTVHSCCAQAYDSPKLFDVRSVNVCSVNMFGKYVPGDGKIRRCREKLYCRLVQVSFKSSKYGGCY